MCGIAGTLFQDQARDVDRTRLRAMTASITHRGPDAEGIWTAPGIGLGHRRLSIIDLAGGDQPIGNEDGSIQVVFNGEIYNFLELRKDLETRGHRFRTHSDTEVLVHLYEELGEDLADRLRGMFAFALWDGHKRQLLLARDRVGQKPLYYYRDHEKLLFGSELKTILADPAVSRELDLEALEEYLAFGIITGERTIFRRIRKLPPAHVMTIRQDMLTGTPRRYWELNLAPDDSRSELDWIERLRSKLDETVLAHRIADVPVGAFLSGGLDSSAVVATLARHAGGPLKTFSIGFHEENYSELPYARQVARQFGTEHIEEIVTPHAVQSLDDLVHFYDEPFGDSSAIPTMYVSRLAAQHVKVVLSGDGGDEAFGGYARYAHDLREAALRARIPAWTRRRLLAPISRVWPKADWLPRALRAKTALTNLALDPPDAYANTLASCRLPLRRELLHGDVRRELNGFRPEATFARAYKTSGPDALRGMISADVSLLLPDDFLTKVDRASMAFGLEVRPPLVDHEFLELAARVPSRFKVRDGETKWIFKQLCADRLPHEIIWRRKQGFEIPVDAWLREPLREVVESTVLDGRSPIAAYIDQDVARRLYQSHRNGSSRQGQTIWSLLVLGSWMNEYLPAGRSLPLTGVSSFEIQNPS